MQYCAAFKSLWIIFFLGLLLLYYASNLTGFHREPSVPSKFGGVDSLFQPLPSLSKGRFDPSRSDSGEFGTELGFGEEVQDGRGEAADD